MKLLCKLFGHKWNYDYIDSTYSGIRFCTRCDKIEIWAAKMSWCNNYANIKILDIKQVSEDL